jgi:hypothetical protein
MTDGPQLVPWFWELLESSGRNLRSLCRKLEQLPKEQLRRYRLDYDEAKDCVNPCCREECQPHLSGDCSEDHGDDFAAWVVMQGREFFERVRTHPEEVPRYLDMFGAAEARRDSPELRWDLEVDRDEYRGYQRADYIATPIYAARFGEDLDDACYDQRGWPREEG